MRVLDNRYCQFLLTCIYFIIKKKKIIILQATQYFKSPSSRYGNFNFKLYLDSSLPKKEQNIFIDEKITRSRNHYAEHIGSCFEPKFVTRARMKRRNFLRKKKKKKEDRKKGGKGSFVRRSAGLSNDWKLGVRKARKFDSSFREGHNT